VMTVWSELRKVAALSGAGPGVSELEPELADLRPGELKQSCLDIALAAHELGWRPKVPIADGLRLTYEALVEEFQQR
jgi:nucleoside-diphosphate-sugar epimerase